MAKSNIAEIDDLLDTSGSPITQASPALAIGAIQDLLRGHRFPGMPGLNSKIYGKFGPATKRAILAFRRKFFPAKPVVAEVDKDVLLALLNTPATNPIASQVYVTRLLDIEFKGYARLACLVAVGEGQGAFAALALNPDKAGLSAGIIQWAQSQERLNELLKAIDNSLLLQAFGTQDRVTRLLAHTKKRKDTPPKVRGGVVVATGRPLPGDADMDLTLNDWPAQFRNLCHLVGVQKTQIKVAASDLKGGKEKFDAVSADAKSERLVAYLLDVFNQFGNGAPSLFKKALDNPPPLPPPDDAHLKDRDREIIKRVTDNANASLQTIGKKKHWSKAFIASVLKSRTRRSAFFTSFSALSDTAFSE